MSFWWIVWQIVMPFKSRPEPIDDLPEPTNEVDAEQVKQCQWIFDQAATRRVYLEQKAQSTFGLMLFLVPLLASLFVFVISKSPTAHSAVRSLAIFILGISATLLFLGFVAAVRGIGVKVIETLFVKAVIDDAGQFRPYNKGFHARGLLYCAAMNEAMNDHIAQFVKGAHVLTAGAVLAIIAAAVPASYVFSALPSLPAETRIVGPVEVASPESAALRDEVANLEAEVSKVLSNGRATADDLKRLQAKFAELDAKLGRLQRARSSVPVKR